MAAKPNVAVIVADYYGTKDTRECLESLHKLTGALANVSIVVVRAYDIDSRENARAEVDALRSALPGVTLVECANEGFAANNNRGMRVALKQLSPDYIMLLNNDTRVDPGCVDALVAFAAKHAGLNLFVPKIYFEKNYEFHNEAYTKKERGKVLWYAGGLIDWSGMYAWHRGVDEVDHGQFDKPAQTEFATGCCMLFPAQVIQSVGFLRSDLYMYLEDLDYSLRVKRRGGEIWFVPDAVVWHKNAGSSGGSGSRFHQYYQTRNRLRLGLQYAPLRTKLALLKEAVMKLRSGTAMEREGTKDGLLGFGGRKEL